MTPRSSRYDEISQVIPSNWEAIEQHQEKWDKSGLPASVKMAAGMAIVAASSEVCSQIDASIKDLGLTRTRAAVLNALYFSKRRSLPLARVSEALMLHPTTVTPIIDRLVRDGFVERVAANDRRVTLARITESGVRAYEAVIPRMTAVNHGLAGLNDEEAQQLLGLLRTLIQT